MREIFKTVPRDWVERLFTWPWRPWQATKQVRDYRAEFEHVRHAKIMRKATPCDVPVRPVQQPWPRPNGSWSAQDSPADSKPSSGD